VILAAGSGDRAKPLTESLPKALVNVAGKTLLDRTLYRFFRAGIQDVTVAIGFKASLVESHLQFLRNQINNKIHIDIVTVKNYEIGPIQTALTAISSFTDEHFFISPADSIISPDIISGMMDQYSRNPNGMMLAVDFGAKSGTRVSVDKMGRITGIGEFALRNEDLTGRSAMLLVTSRAIKEFCKEAIERGENRIASVLNTMIREGFPIHCYNVEGDWFDVDSLSDILRVNKHLLVNAEMEDIDNYVLISQGDLMEIGDKKTMIESDITIESDVIFRGPVLLTSGTRIEKHCRIGPNVTIGSSVRIAERCEIINSVLQDNSEVGPDSRIQNAIVYGTQIYTAEI
jgi:mannose-1-phosphate guanylyltransferase